MNCCLKCLKSRNMILLIVFIAILLDNILLTTIFPIVPKLLMTLDNLHSNCPVVNCSNSSSQIIKDHYLHIKIGFMFTIKPFVQLLINPFVGPITNRIGYSIPMFTGFVILFTSTMLFAFGGNYYFLLVARAVQGIGSACSTVSGLFKSSLLSQSSQDTYVITVIDQLQSTKNQQENTNTPSSLPLQQMIYKYFRMGMLATHFIEDEERGRAFAFALSGLAIGLLVGPPYGGVTYQFISREAPFVILACLTMIDGFLQLLTLKPSIQRETQEGASLRELLKDPYILIAAGSITFGNLGMAVLEPTLPLWMKTTMNSTEWQQGIAFLPSSLSYLIGTNIFGPISHRIGREITTGLGFLFTSGCLISIPFAKRIEHLIAPMCGMGFAVGMIDSSMMPIMGYLVDTRHVAVYGSVYAIADVALCIGFVFGPIISAVLVKAVGFNWMIWIIAIVCFTYAPLTLFLRNPPKVGKYH